ncbi:5'-3' exoribonuclease 1 isoform X2 [Zootermopsis nevadensis]|nr:5'-3' exoribonuclease 1 isoform X2 [Zootermopsis nevadensis]
MNGIIHMCSHPNDFDPHFRITEEKIFKDIFHYIEVLFRMIQPQRLFFMAVDGVAPRAKMNQQRGRRFRSAKEAEILEKKARERGEVLPSDARFDSNCITPGTEFMARLHEQLRYFVTYKVTTDTLWQKVKVILSGHETPGEGEHKIMDYIRYMKSQPGHDPNTRHCLYGLDADLIMLGLCSHEPHFSLLREEVKYGRKAKQQRTSTPEETKFFLLHLSLMREYLELEFGILKTMLSFPFDIEKVIDDWVLMGFLVGNDFIPPLPDMHIINGALPTLYKAYVDVLPTLGGYINEGGTLNLERFQKFMEKLSAYDFEQFRDTYADLKFFQAKTGRRLGSKERHSYKNTGTKENEELFEEDVDAARPVRNTDVETLVQITEQELRPELGTLSEDEDDDVDDWEEYESDEDAHANALFHLEFRQHKKDYYMTKLEYDTVDSDVLRSQADGYVRAIQWNLHYYYNGVCSWSWFYPHHYAPYISDICNFSKNLELNFDMGKPFLPFQQLLAVLPTASKTLLPVPYQQLMSEKESPIFHFYPSEFKTDLNGKKQEWEAVVLIPFIDEESLLEAMAPCEDLLTKEERRRNSHGPMLIYKYTEEDLGQYAAPEYFPPLKSNHALVCKKIRDEIHVDRSRLVRGLCPGVRLDVYFPGFPTLKHIPHTASLQKCKVKVFEQPSQGTNMILQIVDQGKPDIKEVATELLGHTIYVGWPHLVEAKVVSVSNKEFRYGLQEDSALKPPQLSIEEVKGTSAAQWTLQLKGIQEHYANRMGVQIGQTNILVHATTLIGRKYVYGLTGKITIQKQWCDKPTAYALQTTVRDIAVHDRTFVKYRSLQEMFPPKSVCFMLGHPLYGAMGEVIDGGTSVKSGRVKVSMSVTPEPNLDRVRKKHQDSNIYCYMPGNVAAQRLGVSSYLVSRVTGTIYIIQEDKNASADSCKKVNVGLNLKFNKRNEEIPGYTRKLGAVWQYSNKAVDLVQKYMEQFPVLFEHLAKHTGNDVFYESDVLSPVNEGGVSCLTAITDWLKEQPYTKIERQVCGSEIVEAELVQAIEKEVDEFQQHGCRVKTVVMQVKPHLLYKPELQVGNLAPDLLANHRLLDRIVNIRESYTVPLGLKGTIIGIHRTENEAELMYDVLFDKPFPGGLLLNCSTNRGYRLSQLAILNISHGQRVEQVKTVGKPTAVVQPSGNTVVQEDFMYAPWNKQRSIGSGNTAQGHSAFASWNSSQPAQNGVPYAMAPHSSNISTTPLYRTIGSRCASQPTGGGSVPPQPTFLVGSKQQQNTSSSKILKQQNYSSPVAKVYGSAPSKVTSQPPEFQDIWKQLEKTTAPLQKSAVSSQKPSQASPQQQKQLVPTSEIGEDTGTKLLKEMLQINDDAASPVFLSSSSQQVQLLRRHVSIEEMFERVRVAGSGISKDNTSSYCAQLISIFQRKGYGIPRYNYLDNKEDGSVQAQVMLPDMRAFFGDISSTREQASESAAKIALSQLLLETEHQEHTPASGVGKPGTNTLPIPPPQWCQHRQQQPPLSTQTFHPKQHNRQDSVPDWRHGPGPEMIPTGGPPGGRRPFTWQHQQKLPPPPPPFMYASYQVQQQPHWRGSGVASSSTNWRQLPRDSRQQEPWLGSNTYIRRQVPFEEPQQQFIPLQAVKQQRNKIPGALPQQQISRKWPEQQQRQPPTEQNQLVPVEPIVTNKENPVLSRPNSVASKPLVSHCRKSRLAANFSTRISD